MSLWFTKWKMFNAESEKHLSFLLWSLILKLS
jgi:hypothetical protein